MIDSGSSLPDGSMLSVQALRPHTIIAEIIPFRGNRTTAFPGLLNFLIRSLSGIASIFNYFVVKLITVCCMGLKQPDDSFGLKSAYLIMNLSAVCLLIRYFTTKKMVGLISGKSGGMRRIAECSTESAGFRLVWFYIHEKGRGRSTAIAFFRIISEIRL